MTRSEYTSSKSAPNPAGDESDPYLEDITEPGEVEIAQSEDPTDVIPFRYSITSYGADYPVDGLIRRLIDGDIFVPSFQRAYVWEPRRASKFVESLLLGLPVPGIFLSREEPTNKLLVIDGQQRLRTLQYFYAGEFPNGNRFALSGVQPQFEGLGYDDLPMEDRRRLADSILHATVVRQDVPTEDNSSIYHLFARLNTGGLQLTAQEIRACIYHGPFNEYLHDANQDPNWRKVFGPINKRMRDQELILRFFAFLFEAPAFDRSLRDFLNLHMARNRHLSRQPRAELEQAFLPTIALIADGLGRTAFRPRGYLNAAVLDAVMVGVTVARQRKKGYDSATVAKRYRALVRRRAFREATEFGTNAAESVRARLQLAAEAFTD